MKKEIVMWTFPLLSIFLSFLLWKEKVSKILLLVLAIGLTLQIFSFGPVLGLSFKDGILFSLFGKGLLIGVLYFHFGFNVEEKAALKSEKERIRIKFKFILLTGMGLLTVANLHSEKLADGVAAISLILFPALFFRAIRKSGPANLFGFFTIGTASFFAFLFKWAKIVQDPFNLTPLVWMISFASAFFLVGNLKESK